MSHRPLPLQTATARYFAALNAEQQTRRCVGDTHALISAQTYRARCANELEVSRLANLTPAERQAGEDAANADYYDC